MSLALLVQDAGRISAQPHPNTNVFVRLHEWLAPADLLPDWILVLGGIGIGLGVMIGIMALLPLWSVWLERKVSGHIQCRFGPMYAGGWHGWAQTIADGIKLFQKEDMIPTGADRVLFLLAPALVLGSIFGSMAGLPLSYDWYFARMDLGVFMILALGSTTTIGVIMSGWASNSKWSLYGAMREAAQVVAYEIPLGLALLVPLFALGSFSLLDASQAQAGFFGMNWAIFTNPFMVPAFLIFAIAALAETKRAPFDLPEAESELVAGFLTEYSGIRWSFFFMEEYAAMFLMCVLGSFFWFGGFESPATAMLRGMGAQDTILFNVVCFTTLVLKAMVGVFLMIWLRWTLPRVRIDQVMTMGYKYLTPLALLCVLGQALWTAGRHVIFG
ncbi:MAG: NADH-quinone oxidoreductase subunit H [Planctomycetota bacterium]|jgi:NADH-quinone oxidoreductase subunit H